MPISRNCQYCDKRFTSSTERKLFCSDRCKMRYHRENRSACYYCGELASTRDHLFPRKFGNGAGDTVPACRECNSTLNACEPCSIEERIRHLYHSYVAKYHLDKPMPEWSDDELEELGPSLRLRVAAKIRQRQRAIERTLHIRARFRLIRA